MPTPTTKATEKEAPDPDTAAAMPFLGPVGGFLPMSEMVSDLWAAMVWGVEGTGKTEWILKNFPLPIMMENLDRPLTRAHLGTLSDERVKGIFVKNLRATVDEVNQLEALQIKDQLERDIDNNLSWLKGGTLFIDGGTMLRDVLKMADPTIGPKIEKGNRFNPKDKAQVNAYVAGFISSIQDRGINLAMTGHAANSWTMKDTFDEATGQKKSTLIRTANLYPKLDDIAFERANLSLLLFKRCQCGLNITNQDGTCRGMPDPMEDRPAMAGKRVEHEGRHHMVRLVSDKFNSALEGTEWEDLTYTQLKRMSDDRAFAQKMLDAR